MTKNFTQKVYEKNQTGDVNPKFNEINCLCRNELEWLKLRRQTTPNPGEEMKQLEQIYSK